MMNNSDREPRGNALTMVSGCSCLPLFSKVLLRVERAVPGVLFSALRWQSRMCEMPG
ncbi:MAG: hypothetical protein FD166_268 [Bacteroidetes bacterium]|nr:MAG: hypothetical protein FD166_268 [Bacteroidota bacterium]